MIHDSITVEPPPTLLPALNVVGEEEGIDSNDSFSASEAGGDVAETGVLDSAGEEEEETEGEPMDLS